MNIYAIRADNGYIDLVSTMLQKFNPEKANIIVYVGNRLLPCEDAKASVIDGSVQKGSTLDRLLVYQKELFCIEEYRDRPKASAVAHVRYEITTMKNHQRLTEFHNAGKISTHSAMKEGMPVSKIGDRRIMTQSGYKDWHKCSDPSPPYP